MAENITVTIDGKTIDVPQGTLIVEAAKMLGIDIPTFCYDDRMRSVGACRMCLVDVEKMPKLVASCATPVAPKMVVSTDSERVIKARKGVLEFLLINHPLDCPTCDKGGECPLQDMTFDHGPAVSRYKENKIRFIEDINKRFDDMPLGPEVILCRNRCIMCFKCIRIVRDLAGEGDLGVFRRGAFTNINVLREVEFADEFSGNTVEYCPVGALTSRSFRYKIRDWLLKHTPSVCNLCPIGCNMNIDWSAGKVYRYMSRRNKEVDDGWLCDRGRYGFDISRAEDRVIKPHVRRGASLEPCSWDETVMLVSKHLRKIIDENRGPEVAAVGSAMLSNEEAYAIRLFFNDVIKTSDIDYQTDTNQPLEPELIDLIGLSGTIKGLEKEQLFLFVGCDPAIEQPIIALKIKKAVSQRGARAVFLGSYDKKLGYFPVSNFRIPFGAEPEALRFINMTLAGSAAMSSGGRIDEGQLSVLADMIKNCGKIHIISGRGFFAHPDRTGFLTELLSLKNSLNARLSILPPQGNYIGVSHFGLYGEPDRSFNKILSKIDNGDIKTLFVFGANPIDEYPDRQYVQDVFKKLEFLVVVSPFLHATAAMAAVVFPQALLPDYGGTFVNVEGRIQQFSPIYDKINPEIRPAWSILGELSDIMGLGTVWYHDSQVRLEMARNLKGMEGLTSLPETGLLFQFINQNGNGHQAPGKMLLPKAPGDSPYILQWASSVHHNGWLTEKSENLMRISGNQTVVMNTADAGREGLSHGEMVRIENSAGAINACVKVATSVNQGELLVINSFSQNPVNSLMKRDKMVNFVRVQRI